MKTTFLVRDGLCQVVLHPETATERAVLDLVQGGMSVDVHRAHFAEARTGFVRQFGLEGHSYVGSDPLPDTVLVLRPEETQVRVQTTPVETFTPPDDVNTYFRKTADDTWQVYDRQSRVWHPTLGQPEVAGWTYEEQQLRGEMAAIIEHCNRETGFDAVTKLKAIRSLAETALCRDSRDRTHVGGGHD